ncbi:hypothetical protein DFJ63DRAFT_98907 [Scheffersomyces coipomensis]|uniref:uncharacterized protein n=1 Tax=Scheffersomyces coipomensis TaxID=1788519 RepID=UPI00315D18A5
MALDLYEILEISESATDLEVKKAYRKLALKYHPDKASEDERSEAEQKFKDISHAYDILGDETKRRDYDMYGSTDSNGNGNSNGYRYSPYEDMFGGNGNGQGEYGADDFYNFFNNMNGNGYERSSRQTKLRTDDANIEVEVTLEDLFKGKTIRTTSTRNIICTLCKGSGFKKAAIAKKCTTCEGSGHTTRIRSVGPGLVTQESVSCKTCEGTGKIHRAKDKCKKCSGTKLIEETKILEFEIVKGSKSHESIKLPQESDQYPGKQTGDVILTFHCKDHPVFTRKGDNLYSKFKIPLVEALCGFSKIVVKHLDGRGLKFTTPKGKVIKPGDFIKIKNEGMPIKSANNSWFGSNTKRGDLFIEIEVEFPQDNWYLEKNDILKMKNLLPNDLQNKSDILNQTINNDSLPEANIEVITDFTIETSHSLPKEDEKEEDSQPKPSSTYDNYNGYEQYGESQPECRQQ